MCPQQSPEYALTVAHSYTAGALLLHVMFVNEEHARIFW